MIVSQQLYLFLEVGSSIGSLLLSAALSVTSSLKFVKARLIGLFKSK